MLFSRSSKTLSQKSKKRKRAKNVIESENQDLGNIEDDLHDIRKLGRNMKDLIQAQDDMIDELSDHTDDTKHHLEDAGENVRKTKKLKRRCCW